MKLHPTFITVTKSDVHIVATYLQRLPCAKGYSNSRIVDCTTLIVRPYTSLSDYIDSSRRTFVLRLQDSRHPPRPHAQHPVLYSRYRNKHSLQRFDSDWLLYSVLSSYCLLPDLTRSTPVTNSYSAPLLSKTLRMSATKTFEPHRGLLKNFESNMNTTDLLTTHLRLECSITMKRALYSAESRTCSPPHPNHSAPATRPSVSFTLLHYKPLPFDNASATTANSSKDRGEGLLLAGQESSNPMKLVYKRGRNASSILCDH